MTYVAVALLWLASVYRLRMARVRASLITVSYLAAALSIAVAFTIKATEEPFDRVTTPNLSDLLEHLFVVFGGVSAQLFLLGLRDGQRPNRAAATRRLVVAVLVAITMMTLFIIAPLHDAERDLDATYGTLGAVTLYRLVFDAYLTYVLVDNVRLCRRYASRPGEPGLIMSLRLVGWGSLVAIGYSASRLVYALVAMTTTARLTALHTLGSFAAAVGLSGIALGMLAPVVMRDAPRWYRAAQDLRASQRLWRDVTAAFPDLVLRTRPPITPSLAELRRERHVIEIAEGLASIQLRHADIYQHGESDGVSALATALWLQRGRWTTEGDGVPAALLLPTPRDRTEEDRQIVGLAAKYRRAALTRLPTAEAAA